MQMPSSTTSRPLRTNCTNSTCNIGLCSNFSFSCDCLQSNSFLTDSTQDFKEQVTTTSHHEIENSHGGFLSHEIVSEVLKIFEVDDTDELLAAAESQPRVIRVALDSGAGDHVARPADLEGFVVEESPGSKANKHFIAANGQRIANRGQVQAKVSHEGLGTSFGSTFQLAEVSRPLYSVSKMCDTGATVTIDAREALVHKNGRLLARFERQGGLYLADFTVKPRDPAPVFAGQGAKQ